MRSTFFHFALLVGAAVLWAGCSGAEDAEQPERSATSQSPGSWASDEQSSPAEVVPPSEAGRPSETAESAIGKGATGPDNIGASPDQKVRPTTRAPISSGPMVPSTVEEDAGKSVEEDVPSDPQPRQPPSEVPPSESGPENEPPSPFPVNPLRQPAEPSGSSNPMRPSLPSSSNPILREAPAASSSSNGIADVSGRSPWQGASLPPADAVPVVSQPDVSSVGPANPKTKRRSGKHSDVPFDPIKDNGPIFVGWTKPKLAVVITGREDGYIEPCGCAGLDRMKGGLSRRHTMIESLRKKGWPVVAVDVGGFAKGYGRQTEIKFQNTIEAMRKMGYDAIGFGVGDLRLPAGELVSVAADPSPFVSANVGLFGFDANLTARAKIVEAGRLKIGVTAVLGKKYQSEINNQEIELAAPQHALAQIVPRLKEQCDRLILLAYATKEESIALGQRFGDFEIVVTADGPAEPPAKLIRIPGTQSLLIEVGEKGMDAIVVGFYDDPTQPVRYQPVPLDSRFPASKDMYRIMVAYQEQLNRQGLSGLSIRPVSHPQSDVGGEFVGSEKCKSCHEESYRIWKKSSHAKAWKTLVELDPPRNFDPECISCHVIGWHPTKYFPYKTGFLSEKETPEMINTGCETCHGPGGAHCRAEDGSDLDLQEKLYKAIRVTKEESQHNPSKMCQNCHDLDNSPDFDFETYWPDVEHYEDEDDQ